MKPNLTQNAWHQVEPGSHSFMPLGGSDDQSGTTTKLCTGYTFTYKYWISEKIIPYTVKFLRDFIAYIKKN